MKLGNFLVPEMRLDEVLGLALAKIYNTSKTEPIQSKVLAELLGYKYGTEPQLFKKINSMIAYGILEGRGIYSVTKLGIDLLYPESSEMEKRLRTEAIMKVELWKKIYEKHGKNPPKDGLWVSLKNIAEIEPATAKEYENRIYKWYTDDMAHVSEEYLEQKTPISEESEGLSSKEPNNKSVSQTLIELSSDSFGRVTVPNVGYVDVTDEDTLEIARTYFKVLEKKVKSAKGSQKINNQSESENQPHLFNE